MSFPNQLAPNRASVYTSSDRYPAYYKRTGKFQKSGQSWDLFVSWGQAQIKVNSDGQFGLQRQPFNYRATSFTVPIIPPNVISEEFNFPLLEPNRIRSEMSLMKQKLKEQIVVARNSHLKYGSNLKKVQKIVKQALKNVCPDFEELDENAGVTTESIDENVVSANSHSSPNDSVCGAAIYINNDNDVSSSGGNILDHPLVDNILMGYQQDSRLFEEINLRVIPHDYLGGTLSLINNSSNHTTEILHSAGAMMDQIVLRTFNHHSTDQLTNSVLHQQNFKQPLKQIAHQEYSSFPGLTGVRGASKICFYNRDGSVLTEVDKILVDKPQHLSVNPYYPSAVYVYKNEVFTWTEQSNTQQVYTNWAPKFTVQQDTRTVHYGSHPLQLILTDPTNCTTYDMRTKRGGQSLFEVSSNKYLHKDERLVTSTQANYFQHHILAQHTLLTIDERFPKYPFIYQALPTLTWPMLLNNYQLDSTRNLILVGCPTKQDVFCMLADLSEDGPSTTPIWKCSQVDDMVQFRKTQPEIYLRDAVKERLQSGILGLGTSSAGTNQFSIFQLTGHGDLFQQTYKLTENLEEDVTKAAGTRYCNIESDDHVVVKCKCWYSEIQTIEKSLLNTTDNTHQIIIPSLDNSAHKLCPLCKGKQLSSSPTRPENRCLCCDFTLDQSNEIVQAVKALNIATFQIDDHPLPKEIEQFSPWAFADPNSILLTKLWYDEDISEVLEERNLEWEKQRDVVRASLIDKRTQLQDDASSQFSGTTTRSVGELNSGSSSYSSSTYCPSVATRTSIPGFSNTPSRIRLQMDNRQHVEDVMDSTPLMQGVLDQVPEYTSAPRKKKGRLTKGF